MASEQHFCPQCGSAVGPEDRFCRNCGTTLDAPEGAETESAPAAKPRRRRRIVLVAAILAVLLGAGAAAAVIFTGVLEEDESPASQVDPRLVRAYEREMEERDEFFKAERSYLAAFDDANAKLETYQEEQDSYEEETKRIDEEYADEFDRCAQEFDVPCPDPTYPDPPTVPEFDAESRRLRRAGTQLEELHARLTAQQPPARLRSLHALMLASVEALEQEAEHNADVLAEAVQPGEGGEGVVDEGKVKTLRKRTALPSIRQMNREAVRLARALARPLREYDVPGGRDLDPADHSDDV
jgi:hypothetical protein